MEYEIPPNGDYSSHLPHVLLKPEIPGTVFVLLSLFCCVWGVFFFGLFSLLVCFASLFCFVCLLVCFV